MYSTEVSKPQLKNLLRLHKLKFSCSCTSFLAKCYGFAYYIMVLTYCFAEQCDVLPGVQNLDLLRRTSLLGKWRFAIVCVTIPTGSGACLTSINTISIVSKFRPPFAFSIPELPTLEYR